MRRRQTICRGGTRVLGRSVTHQGRVGGAWQFAGPPGPKIDYRLSTDILDALVTHLREVTDKPILYLVNTNYHGNHTFGNYAFPEDATGNNPGRKKPNGETL